MTLSKTFSCCDNNLQIKRNETFFNIKQKEKKEKNDSLVTPVNKTFLVLFFINFALLGCSNYVYRT